MASQEFPASVVVSTATGMTLCPFERIHECAEFVMGHPVWTHELGTGPTTDRLHKLLLSQHPWISDVNTASVAGDAEAAMAMAASLDRAHGSVRIQGGQEVREKDPLTTLNDAIECRGGDA